MSVFLSWLSGSFCPFFNPGNSSGGGQQDPGETFYLCDCQDYCAPVDWMFSFCTVIGFRSPQMEMSFFFGFDFAGKEYETDQVFISNLSSTVTEADIKDLFGSIGIIKVMCLGWGTQFVYVTLLRKEKKGATDADLAIWITKPSPH